MILETASIYVWHLVGAIAAGAVIGFEREYRGSPAGLRTHVLVALTPALLMLVAVHEIRWLAATPTELIRIDPVRMAHGVLTGVGFISTGVILREGANIRGLITAASLWITSALGMLSGVGFFGLALAGASAALIVLAGINLTERWVPQRRYLDLAARNRVPDAPTAAELML